MLCAAQLELSLFFIPHGFLKKFKIRNIKPSLFKLYDMAKSLNLDSLDREIFQMKIKSLSEIEWFTSRVN